MSAFDIAGIDDVIHGRIRLGIMAYLSGAGASDFNALKSKLATTDGNLSVHLRKLEDAGYVTIDKRFIAKKPQTRVKLTAKGRSAFAAYLDAIATLLNEVR